MVDDLDPQVDNLDNLLASRQTSEAFITMFHDRKTRAAMTTPLRPTSYNPSKTLEEIEGGLLNYRNPAGILSVRKLDALPKVVTVTGQSPDSSDSNSHSLEDLPLWKVLQSLSPT